MFTRLTLHNFRCFEKIEFDLTSKKDTPKHLALIYGENGAGKSNLMSAFVLLNELLNTLNVRDLIEELLSQKSIFSDESYERIMKQTLVSELRDIQAIIDDVRMVGSDEPIFVEYEFSIGGRIGTYCIELGETEIKHERLEFLLNKRKGVFFDCSNNKIQINDRLFVSPDTKAEIEVTAKKYWGKHSILAIILYELQDKSTSFGWDNISDNFADVLSEFVLFSSTVKIGSRTWQGLKPPIPILTKAVFGSIPVTEESQLDLLEDIFTGLFSATNTDIRRVYYDRKTDGNRIRYQLFFEKKIAGKYRQIIFDKESKGTHNLLDMFCYILTACLGGTVVVDEADSGIHDALFRKVLQETYDHIEGQLIMTTHNTMLMETEFGRDSVYILRENDQGESAIKCVNEFEKRTFANNNIRNKYYNGAYGGFPEVRPIQIESQIAALHDFIDCE